MGDRGTTLGAEDTVVGMARSALSGPALDGALDSQLIFGHDGDESFRYQLTAAGTIGTMTHSRSIHSGAGSRRSDRKRQCPAVRRQWYTSPLCRDSVQ